MSRRFDSKSEGKNETSIPRRNETITLIRAIRIYRNFLSESNFVGEYLTRSRNMKQIAKENTERYPDLLVDCIIWNSRKNMWTFPPEETDLDGVIFIHTSKTMDQSIESFLEFVAPELNIQTVIFDFDNTLTIKFTCNDPELTDRSISYLDIPNNDKLINGSTIEQINDNYFGQENISYLWRLFALFQAYGMAFGVASYGRRNAIIAMLNNVMRYKLFNSNNVVTPNSLGTQWKDCTTSIDQTIYNKNLLIDHLMDVSYDRSSVLLVDDNKDNIDRAVNGGFIGLNVDRDSGAIGLIQQLSTPEFYSRPSKNPKLQKSYPPLSSGNLTSPIKEKTVRVQSRIKN